MRLGNILLSTKSGSYTAMSTFIKPLIPINEQDRLATLQAYDILDTLPEAAFDDLSLLASYICQTPIALVSLIDEERQWFKSRIGVEVSETPRDISFCGHAILTPEEVFVVPNALEDERFAANPLVVSDPAIRFYAGAPLVTPEGHTVGTLCVIDSVPRELTGEQLTALQALSRQVTSQLVLRRKLIQSQHINDELERQIAERARLETRLSHESSLLQALMDNVPEAIYFKDTQSRFTRVSRHHVHLRGITSPDEAVGKTDFDFFTEEHARQAYDDEQRIVSTGEPITGKVEKETFADGSVGYVLSTKVPIRDTQGRITGIVGVSSDITRRVRLEHEMEQARDAVLEVARLKSEFLANMSHEIRTPMNGVLGMTGLLLDTPLDDEQRDFAEIIQSSADSLLTIINDILDFSKIESGKLTFETIDFDLRHTIESTTEILAERAHAKSIELASLVYDDVSVALRGDPGRLRQILTNLIGNAIKFTETGEVVVRATKHSENATHTAIRFTVTDTGIGIPATAQQNLFQPFMQADGSTTREYGGTGLGLAISKQLVELMGGEIGVESVPGGGSTFWFTVSLEKQAADAPKVQVKESLAGMRVLVVDDNATNRKILMHQTAAWGMVPAQAEDARRALEMLRAAVQAGEAFDLAILDLMMPEMDGFELAREINSDATIASIPLVLLTSFGQRGHADAARGAGIAAYLTKPVKQVQLFECLTTVISSVNQPRRAASQATAPDGCGQAATLVTRHSLLENAVASDKLILLAEDNLVNQKLALRQLKKLGYAADAVLNGREALEAMNHKAYDLVLMDCQMPEMDGYETTAEIRRREQSTGAHTPIVAMTAHALEGDRAHCLAAGMDDYVTKPVKFEMLNRIINNWIAQPETRPAAQPSLP